MMKKEDNHIYQGKKVLKVLGNMTNIALIFVYTFIMVICIYSLLYMDVIQDLEVIKDLTIIEKDLEKVNED